MDQYRSPALFTELDKLFSGEEGGGRFLDLNAVFERFVNLKGVRKNDYLLYLSEFDDFEGLYPKETKKTVEYKQYV